MGLPVATDSAESGGDPLYMTGVMNTFLLLQRVIIVWPGAARAPIGVRLNPQVCSVQQHIHGKFHLDRHPKNPLSA